MNGVSKLTTAENVMMVSFSDVTPLFMSKTLTDLANEGIVVDMISQTAPHGTLIRFSFTASFDYFSKALAAIGSEKQSGATSPMISGGYSKINLFGEEMVDSVGVAARALETLGEQNVEIAMITTSDLDISLLVRQEDEDVACDALRKRFSL